MSKTQPILELRDVYKSFGRTEVLQGIDLRIEQYERLAVTGPSGSGKSSLLRCLNNLEPIDRGTIYFHGNAVVEADPNTGRNRVNIQPRILRQRVGMVFQEYNLWPNKTILENLTEGPRVVLKKPGKACIEQARELLAQVGLTSKAENYPNELSGGQRQRAAIARALAMEPEVPMFDEVTSALDPMLTLEVLDVIRKLTAQNRTLLVVTHHMQFARAIGDRIAFFWRGKIHEIGAAAELLDEPRTPELREFLGKLELTH